MTAPSEERLRRLTDRLEIEDALALYARAVDRGDWQALRSVYHPDAVDDHAGFRGDRDQLIAWLEERFAGVDNSMHFLGNRLIEFAGPDRALAETYFVSRRLLPASDQASGGDRRCRESWGRYVDRFERRDGAWRIAERRVVLEGRLLTTVQEAARDGADHWSRRDGADPVEMERQVLFRRDI